MAPIKVANLVTFLMRACACLFQS